ncbi:MAG: efflux RND transporter periplasmic adaptor subunit [Gemmataceae bacterium]|nr:efflux RND transporter periplasmic adaptor subunit [Gemmataceae bacterium]
MRTFPSLAGPGLLLLTLLSAGCGDSGPKLAPTAPPVVSVSVPVERQVADYEDFTGRIAAVETVELRAQVTGYLKSIHFKEGSEVIGGDRAPTFVAAGIGVLAAPWKKGPLLAIASLPIVRHGHGDLLFEIDRSVYQAAVDQARANVALAEATVKERETAYQIAVQAGVGTTKLELAQRLGQFEQAQAQLQAAYAALEKARIDLGFTTIRAPISGKISRFYVTEGNLVRGDQTSLTTIVSQDPMHVYFDVDEMTMLRIQEMIRRGKFKTYSARRLPVYLGLATDGEQRPYEATIDFVDNKVNPATGSIAVRAVLPNPRLENGLRRFTPGLFVRVRLPIGEPQKRLLITDRAVGSDQGQKYVYVVNDKNQVERRDVQLGRRGDGLRVVERYREMPKYQDGKQVLKDGAPVMERVEVISPRDRVIVGGLQRVRAGVAVEPKLVAMPVSAAPAGK